MEGQIANNKIQLQEAEFAAFKLTRSCEETQRQFESQAGLNLYLQKSRNMLEQKVCKLEKMQQKFGQLESELETERKTSKYLLWRLHNPSEQTHGIFSEDVKDEVYDGEKQIKIEIGS